MCLVGMCLLWSLEMMFTAGLRYTGKVENCLKQMPINSRTFKYFTLCLKYILLAYCPSKKFLQVSVPFSSFFSHKRISLAFPSAGPN